MPVTRALPMYQPWASLVAIGAKRWETRPRRCHLRELVAIYATKKWDFEFAMVARRQPFKDALGEEYFAVSTGIRCGCIVGVAEITECVSTTEWIRRHCRQGSYHEHENEYQFGNYSPGRFAWKMDNARLLPRPIAASGHQGFIHIDTNIAAAIESQLAASK